MGESWVGFSGSYPFGSVAYDGSIEESTRCGGDAQPVRGNKARILRRTTNFLCPLLLASLQKRRKREYRSAHRVLCHPMPSALPGRIDAWFTKHMDFSSLI